MLDFMLIIKETQIKTTMSYHFTRVKISKSMKKNAGEGVEKREPSYTAGVNWHNHYGKQYGGTSES